MQVEYINPFVNSLVHVFQTMLDCQARRSEICLTEGRLPTHSVSGVIGLSGRAKGTVVLSLSEEVALRAASAMLLTEFAEVNEEVVDAVGELTNMVAGGAKAQLEEFQLRIGLPNVVTGRDHEIHFPLEATPIRILFESDWGPLSVEVGFVAVAEAVEV